MLNRTNIPKVKKLFCRINKMCYNYMTYKVLYKNIIA